jgi:hypothetical protein
MTLADGLPALDRPTHGSRVMATCRMAVRAKAAAVMGGARVAGHAGVGLYAVIAITAGLARSLARLTVKNRTLRHRSPGSKGHVPGRLTAQPGATWARKRRLRCSFSTLP